MPTLVKCDFDLPAVPADFAARLSMALGVHQLRPLWRCDYRSRHGWHVTVAVGGRVALWRVLVIQAALGSDWRRELFNSARLRHWRRLSPVWRERINVLYHAHYRGVGL